VTKADGTPFGQAWMDNPVHPSGKISARCLTAVLAAKKGIHRVQAGIDEGFRSGAIHCNPYGLEPDQAENRLLFGQFTE